MRRILFTLLALFCCFGGVLAEKIERDTLHVEMHAVSVVAVRERTIVKPQVLTDSVLQRLNSQSVADALRYFTGVQVKDYGGIGGIKTVNIRSMGTNHVGVFYNGVQLGNAQNGQVDLGRYSLDNVESISLYNGQKSDIFQTAKDFSASSAICHNQTPAIYRRKTLQCGCADAHRQFRVGKPFASLGTEAWRQHISVGKCGVYECQRTLQIPL